MCFKDIFLFRNIYRSFVFLSISEPNAREYEAVRQHLQQQMVHGDLHHPVSQQERSVWAEDLMQPPDHLLSWVCRYEKASNKSSTSSPTALLRIKISNLMLYWCYSEYLLHTLNNLYINLYFHYEKKTNHSLWPWTAKHLWKLDGAEMLITKWVQARDIDLKQDKTDGFADINQLEEIMRHSTDELADDANFCFCTASSRSLISRCFLTAFPFRFLIVLLFPP